jgi:hypothetical protein
VDTQQFLDAVLPQGGRRCIGALSRGEFQNFYGSSNEWASKAVTSIDAAGHDAYFALGGYGPDRNRRQANVVALRSFWIDIDTNENGKGRAKYANRKEAVIELRRFTRELDLPEPLLVSSGNGVHAYWRCDEDISPDAWKKTATLLKRACRTWGLDADPTRTADSASVLRPIGTRNHKGEPKPVKLLSAGEVTSHPEFHLQLEQYLADRGISIEESPVENLNSDLISKREFLPSHADLIAEKCEVMREIRDYPATVEEPVWYAGLSVLLHTVEGEAACHEWSKGHPRYSKAETNAKIANARPYGPATCERFSDHRPGVCANCPFNGKVKSPISLGVSTAQPPPPPSPDKLPPDMAVALRDVEFPEGFGWTTGSDGKRTMWKRVVPEKSEDETVPPPEPTYKYFSNALFFPTTRVQQRVGEDALYSMDIVVYDEQGERRTFTMDSGLVADAGTMAQELSRREIPVTAGNRAVVTEYLAAWINKMRAEYTNTPMIEQFGWTDKDEFVVGTDLISRTGKARAILTNSANNMGQYLSEGGDLETWVDTVDQIYNHLGQEPLQFCILASFAAPLWALCEDNPRGGTVIFAHSPDSGYGKSTAQRVGLSAWGKHEHLTLRDKNFTEAALYQHIGVMKNLPVVVDEMTNVDKRFASEFAYNMSDGVGKFRLTQTAVHRKPLNWATIVAMSGNTMITERLSEARANSEAEMLRVWEFGVNRKGHLDPNAAMQLFGTFNKHYGVAGRRYIEYVVANLDEVRKQLMHTRMTFNTRMNITQGERYWSQLHACVLTALSLCRELDILKFDMTAMVKWIATTLAANRSGITQNVSTPLDQFAQMLTEITSGFIVTRGEGHLTVGAPAEILIHPHGAITGRHILADRNCREEMLIPVAVARAWCGKHGISFKDMHNDLVNRGMADKDVKRVSLGKGTDKYSGLGGPVKCMSIQMSKVRAASDDVPAARAIVGVVTGTRGIDDDVRHAAV